MARTPVILPARVCHDCGYDLRATPNYCPECGAIWRDPKPSGRLSTRDVASVVVGSVIALAIIIAPQLLRGSGQTISSRESTDIINLSQAVGCFATDTGRVPTTQEGWQALITCPAGAVGWRGPYIQRTPLDRHGRPYKYVYDPKLECYYISYQAKDGRERGSAFDAAP